MSVKPVKLGDLLNDFADYISTADVISARLLAKISATIVKKRVEMNMTQKEFAKYMEVSQGMISKWEGEDYNFTIETLAKICDKLDLNIEIQMESENDKYKKLLHKKGYFVKSNWKIEKEGNLIKLDEAV